jgi:hypothetical protein
VSRAGPFYSNASRAPRVGPGRLPCATGVAEVPGGSIPVGIAYGAGRVGGYDSEDDRDLGPAEAVWRLVVREEEIDGRFVLRGGRFVELAEDAG